MRKREHEHEFFFKNSPDIKKICKAVKEHAALKFERFCLCGASTVAQYIPQFYVLVSGTVKNGKIVCPYCGYDGSRPSEHGRGSFRYLEDIVNHRIVGELKGKTLHIASFYETGEGYDDGTNARLECRNCLGEFDLPDDLSVEFV